MPFHSAEFMFLGATSSTLGPMLHVSRTAGRDQALILVPPQ